MNLQSAVCILCTNGVTRSLICPHCPSETKSATHIDIAYHASQLGAQFNTLQPEVELLPNKMDFEFKNTIPPLKNESQVRSPTDIVPDFHKTYQLARYLDEPADYRSNAVKRGTLDRKEKEIERLTALREQVQALEGVVNGDSKTHTKKN